MKRSPELTPLSHEHHQALFAAQRLRRASEVEDARPAFLEFWRGHGRAHFAIEEEILLPGWVEADDGFDRELTARVAAEHLTIRTAARAVERGEVSVEELRELGELLERHVRFEERELFPLIESRLDRGTLEAIGEEIAERQPSRYRAT